jgi:integrase/recombinase XerD
MSLGRQAKVLNRAQVHGLLGHLEHTRYPLRNRVIALLSLRAGLRAKEIAGLTWSMVTDSSGQVGNSIHLRDVASKGRSGRIIPLNRELRAALVELFSSSELDHVRSDRVVATERGGTTSARIIVHLFRRWYADLGYDGCSSHSGRRTFVTECARKIGQCGGSLRDVQQLAGHASLSTTQKYIAQDVKAQKRVIDLL